MNTKSKWQTEEKQRLTLKTKENSIFTGNQPQIA